MTCFSEGDKFSFWKEALLNLYSILLRPMRISVLSEKSNFSQLIDNMRNLPWTFWCESALALEWCAQRGWGDSKLQPDGPQARWPNWEATWPNPAVRSSGQLASRGLFQTKLFWESVKFLHFCIDTKSADWNLKFSQTQCCSVFASLGKESWLFCLKALDGYICSRFQQKISIVGVNRWWRGLLVQVAAASEGLSTSKENL